MSILAKFFILSLFFVFSCVSANESDSDPQDFALISVDVIAQDAVKLYFTHNIEDHEEATREFKLININDDLEQLFVLRTEIDSLKSTDLIVQLDSGLELGGRYQIQVIDIKSENGLQIESGINTIGVFNVPESGIPETLTPTPIQEDLLETEPSQGVLSSSGTTQEGGESLEESFDPNDTISSSAEEKITFQSADNSLNDVDDSEELALNSASLAGSGIVGESVQKDTISESESIKKLPDTGPSTYLLIVIVGFLMITFFVLRGFSRV